MSSFSQSSNLQVSWGPPFQITEQEELCPKLMSLNFTLKSIVMKLKGSNLWGNNDKVYSFWEILENAGGNG